MLETLRSAWRIKELRQRITFTLLMLVVSPRLTCAGTGIDQARLQTFQQNNLFGLFNVLPAAHWKDTQSLPWVSSLY